MSTYRTQIRAAAVQCLAVQIQPERILTGQQWPLGAQQLPAILVDMREEQKTSQGQDGPPSFDVQGTLVIRAREAVSHEPGAMPFGYDHGRAVEAVCDKWIDRIQDALLGEAGFVAMFSSISALRVETQAFSEDSETIVAEAGVTLTLTWEESWPPRVDDALGRLVLRVDNIDPQDPNGAYVPPAGWPAPAPPPRERGPDGRAEIGADLEIPTT